jgi:hypothetical protein
MNQKDELQPEEVPTRTNFCLVAHLWKNHRLVMMMRERSFGAPQPPLSRMRPGELEQDADLFQSPLLPGDEDSGASDLGP